MTQVKLWCVLSNKCALVHNGCPDSNPMKRWRNQLRYAEIKWKSADSSCKKVYCFHEFTWFFCKLLDIKERSAVWPLENAGGYSSLTLACRAPILAQSSSACQTTLQTKFQNFMNYEGVNFRNFWSICPGMPHKQKCKHFNEFAH